MKTSTARLVLAASAAVFALGLVLAPQRSWAGLLLVSFGLLTLGLAGALILAVHDATSARWNPVLMDLPADLTRLLPAGAVGLAAVVALRPSLWPWTAGLPEASALQRTWLTHGFFVARSALYLALWLGGAHLLVARHRARRPSRALGGLLTVAFIVTIGLASVDWIMSLTPRWSSTLFGWYHLVGLVVAGLATMLLLGLARQVRGVLADVPGQDVQDVATFFMGACGFWMYLWFCQYMLIWYANIPDEAVYYAQRAVGPWAPLFVANLLLSGALPFIVLLPREAKRSPRVLGRAATMVLVGRCLDLYLMVAPAAVGARPMFGLWELNLALAGVTLAGLALRGGREIGGQPRTDA